MTTQTSYILRLIEKYQQQNNPENLNQLINLFDPKIRSVITKSNAVSYEDLYQEAILTFIECVSEFSEEKYGNFEGYFTTRVKRELSRFYHKNTRAVAMVTNSRVQKAMRHMLSLGKSSELRLSQLQVTEISKELEISRNDALIAYLYLSTDDHQIKADETKNYESEALSGANSMPMATGNEIVEQMIQDRDTESLHEQLYDTISILSSRERKIVEQRWLTESKSTLKALASDLDISKERVRQIQEEAFSLIRQDIARYA